MWVSKRHFKISGEMRNKPDEETLVEDFVEIRHWVCTKIVVHVIQYQLLYLQTM